MWNIYNIHITFKNNKKKLKIIMKNGKIQPTLSKKYINTVFAVDILSSNLNEIRCLNKE